MSDEEETKIKDVADMVIAEANRIGMTGDVETAARLERIYGMLWDIVESRPGPGRMSSEADR